MYVISANDDIVFIDVTKFHNDVELHSFIWKVKYDVEFSKKEDFIKKFVENVF